MSKEVTVEELPERINDVVAAIDAGETVTIVRDGRKIASVTPTVISSGVRYPFRNLKLSPSPPGLADEAVRQLIEERDYERSGKKYGR